MQPVRVSFDLDGVLANYVRGFTRFANSIYGTPVGDQMCQRTYHFEDFRLLGLTTEQVSFVWKAIDASTDFWLLLDTLCPSTMKRIAQLRNVVFVTSRSRGVDVMRQSVKWLERFGIERPLVMRSAPEDKVFSLINIGAIAHLDDLAETQRVVQEMMPSIYAPVLLVPYNQLAVEHSGVECVLSVDHYLDVCDARGWTEYA